MTDLSFKQEFRPVYTSLVEQITEFLTNAIVECQLKAGQHLIESELQRQFKVSRAPIREAFRILQKNGLVTTIPRKGTFVRTIDRRSIEENFSVRAILESYAARLAVSNLEAKDIERMESSLSKMGEALKNKNFRSYLRHHTELHQVFIHASKNETLIGIIENLKSQSLWFNNTYMAISMVEEFSKYLIQVHRDIVNSFIKKDIISVENRVKEHMLHALKRSQALFAKIEIT